MTRDEFEEKFKVLWKEFNSEGNMEFLLAIALFDKNNDVKNVEIYSAGCPCCIIDMLIERVQEGDLKHLNEKESRVH